MKNTLKIILVSFLFIISAIFLVSAVVLMVDSVDNSHPITSLLPILFFISLIMLLCSLALKLLSVVKIGISYFLVTTFIIISLFITIKPFNNYIISKNILHRNIEVESNKLTTELSNDKKSDTITGENFKTRIINGLKTQKYNVEYSNLGYKMYKLEVGELFANDIVFFGPGSQITDSIEGCALGGGISKNTQYRDSCNTLMQILNITDSIDSVIDTFNETTQRSEFFRNNRYVWYLKYSDVLDEFSFHIFDMTSIGSCMQVYDLNNWVDFDEKMLTKPTIYSGSKIKLLGECISVLDIDDKNYVMKKSLNLKLNSGTVVEVIYDYGYFPYEFKKGLKYEVYGTLSNNQVLLKFVK